MFLKYNNFINIMIKNFGIPFILAGLLALLINPFDWWMNGTLYMCVVASILVLFCIFAVFFWKEKARDERELAHTLFAGRVAYFLGASVLVIAVVVQSFKHSIDPWIPVALLFMIIGKSIAMRWSSSRN